MELRSQIILEAKKELARRDFWQFCLYYDYEFFSKRTFLEEVAIAFMKIHRNEIKRLSVSMPPRAGKSYITSLFCAWTLGKFPEDSVMRNTCTARLYEKFSYDVRGVVKNEKFQAVFTDVKLAMDKQAVNGWNLTNSRQVGYFGAGVGGTIIGFGATKLAVTDDLYKSLEDALSENVNEKVLSWVEATHGSRLETGCPKIDIGTRWTKRDVIGVNMENGRYDESIVIAALDENGNSFCEHVKTTDEYQQIKNEIDEVIFLAEYQQEPIEAKGLLFPKSELRYYNPDKNLKFETSIGYVAVADEGSDNLSAPIGKNIGTDIYITDVLFTKENSEITEPLLTAKLKENDVKYCRIEANNMGGIYARNIMAMSTTEIFTAVSTSNKHTRILMDAGFIKRHCLFLAEEHQSKEYKAFMVQLTEYLKAGGSKHDDAPDSLSGLVIFIRAILEDRY
mgnify:CR=1 FL=1